MANELSKKSIHDLRVIAQSFGVPDIFEKDALHLVQEIELKQQNLVPPAIELPPKPEYDARLMTKPPSRRTNMGEITELLEPYIKMGLRLRFDEESWYMDYQQRNDSGTIRMPLRTVLAQAERLMR